MTKRALIVGAQDDRPGKQVRPRPSVATMQAVLEELGGWSIEVLEGAAASREGILAGLERLAAAVEAEDAVLFYFFGHGGVVQIRDAPDWIGPRPLFYLSATRTGPSEDAMIGVLDVELSAILGRIDGVCANVSVILDCCHSAQIVRGDILDVRAPSWLPPQDPTGGQATRAESHPRIVRLTGSSSLNFALARHGEHGELGLLTEGLAAVIREAGGVDRLCWENVAHRVRERAIQAKRCEIQWVTLAGPGDRLLFARAHAEQSGSVGFVAGRDGEPGWLRAGLLQGVEVGDLWGIAGLTLDEQGRPQIQAQVRVVAVDLNRARVESVVDSVDANALPDGSSAVLLRARQRLTVAVGGAEALQGALRESALVRPAEHGNASAWARVDWRREDDGVHVRVRRGDDTLAVIEVLADAGAASIWTLALLEDWARAEALLRALARAQESCPPTAGGPPVRVSWGRCEAGRDQPVAGDGDVTLREGDQLYFELVHRGLSPDTWYVSAVEIGVDGRARLIDAAEPEGRAVAPRRSEYLGRRARNFKTGRALSWPTIVPREQPRVVTVVLLMSLRPIQLGHLVPGWLPTARVEKNRRTRAVTRRTGEDPGWIAPQVTGRWAWIVLRARVEPR